MPASDAPQTSPPAPPPGIAVGLSKPSDPPAAAKIRAACDARRSYLSVGLEPSAEYMPSEYAPDLRGYERFLMAIIENTIEVAAAFKFNLAFFESLGPPGVDLLYRVRRALPTGAYVIADAKRGDIGSTAEHYARALYEEFDADAATVNPLMGRDSAEPFLKYEDRLTFFLVLTSNPGAADVLLAEGLYRRLASTVASWNSRGNVGLVVGATRPEHVGEVRALAGGVPFLIPGIGAQGGALTAAADAGRAPGPWPAMLFHVTRGVLPPRGDPEVFGASVQRRAAEWRAKINSAVLGRDGPETRT